MKNTDNADFKQRTKAFFNDWLGYAKKRWWVMLIELAVIGVILLADLLTKEHVVKFLSTQSGLFYELIPGFINLQYTENTGAGFGIFQGNTVALTAVTMVVVIGLLIYLFFALKENEWLRISLIFIIGGGIGNIVDRIALGYVRDFIQFAFWEEFAIFNIADSFVVIGAFLLVIVLIVMLVKEGKKNKKEFEDEQAKNPEAEELTDPLDAPVNLNPMLSSKNEYTFEDNAAESDTREKAADDNTADDKNDVAEDDNTKSNA